MLARRLGVLAAFSLLAIAAHAETFDLVNFTAPAGTRRATAEALSFTDATPTRFAVCGICKGAPGGAPAQCGAPASARRQAAGGSGR